MSRCVKTIIVQRRNVTAQSGGSLAHDTLVLSFLLTTRFTHIIGFPV